MYDLQLCVATTPKVVIPVIGHVEKACQQGNQDLSLFHMHQIGKILRV